MLDRKKHRLEEENLKADNRMKDMELGKAYVDEFCSNIARPLQEEGQGTYDRHLSHACSEE